MDAKQPEYTQKNIDILNNFKCSAEIYRNRTNGSMGSIL